MNRVIFLLALLPAVLSGQHSIKGTFSPAGEFEIVLLYKVEPTVSSYVTNTKIEADGHFEFKLDSTITKGMYRLVYALPQEEYNFDIIYNGKEDIELAFNSETGVEFSASRENKLLESYTNSMFMITNSIGSYYRDDNTEKDSLALLSIFKTQRENQNSFEEAAKGTMSSHFIKANSLFIPEKVVDAKTYVQLLKTHYFDHVDFNNAVLQRSKFLTERMLNYVFGMADQSKEEPDAYKDNIVAFVEAMKDAPPAIKKSLFTDLWEQMVDLKMESVANFISENYLMDLAVNLNDQELLRVLILYKDTSIGSDAPDFSFEANEKEKTASQTLSELNGSEHYVLVFWSSTCSHCLEEIPQLHEFSKSLATEKLKVIAIGLEDEPYAWKNLTYEYPNFLHVYGEGKWDNEIGDSYGVTATPTYFILSSDKKIVAKPMDFEELKALFVDND
ncbi:TlpA family protein disulfide reductase [Hyunsoonleella rubra]|uniref:TlpA family protein disulfide reductase n=1 Tax=Hyunsoonleella rubra TaxID=1737062 RepID=A0ABW5TDK3_9FLAO